MSDPISTVGIAQLQRRLAVMEQAVKMNTKAISDVAELLAVATKQNSLMASVTELSARLEGRMKPPPPEAHQAICEHPENFT